MALSRGMRPQVRQNFQLQSSACSRCHLGLFTPWTCNMARRRPSKESNLSDSCCECCCQCCAVDGEEREDVMPGGPQVTMRLSLDVPRLPPRTDAALHSPLGKAWVGLLCTDRDLFGLSLSSGTERPPIRRSFPLFVSHGFFFLFFPIFFFSFPFSVLSPPS